MKKVKQMKTIIEIKWLLSYADKSKRNIIMYIIIGLLMVGVWIINPILITKQTLYLTSLSWENLYHLAFLIFGIHFFYSFLKYFISYHAQKYIHATYKNIHLDITNHFFSTTISNISKKSSGYYIERMTDDTIDIADFFINLFDNLIDIFIQIGYLITIFLINKLIFCFYLYFLILLYRIKKVKTRRYIEEEKKKKEAVEILMNENVENIKTCFEIKCLNLKKYRLKLISKKIDRFNESNFNRGEVNRFFLFLTNNIQNVFRLLLVSLSIYLIIQDKLSVASALIMINYETEIFCLLDVLETFEKNKKIFELASNRIKEILENNQKEIYGNKKIEEKETSLEFQDVSFSYQAEKQILNQISFEIKEKEHIAIVGMSGSGKSTLFHLITRLYSPNKGKILLNGQNIEEYQEKEVKNMITIVSQSPSFFHQTILENLKLENQKLSKQDIIKACKIAQIHEDIMSLPNRYQTILEENTTNLSGGQKQRLAIARALLRNTPILLLDEATSALDNQTQEVLLKELQAKTKNKIVITIAHRLSTIIHSDKILILDKGKIMGIGTHQELLKTNKYYQKLYHFELEKNSSIR